MKKLTAAFIFFTRLPLWRFVDVPAEQFKRVVDLWSLTGLLTGGIMAATVWFAAMVFPLYVAVITGLCVRMLFTSALHEDGLADFFDGMGGGTSRERILAIMKDSHIGTYGVTALTAYFMLAVATLSSMSVAETCLLIFAADAWSKFCASQIINLLPYCRTEATAKNRTVYSRMSAGAWLLNFMFGALPLLLLPDSLMMSAVAPVAVSGLLILYMRHKIGGYTGDCCGAVFLLSELSMCLTACAICN